MPDDNLARYGPFNRERDETMRIHTDTPDAVLAAIHGAARDLDGVYAETTRHGSRSRAAALELVVTADKRKGRRPRNGYVNDTAGEYGATWDEWGAIFAAIFDADPTATCRAYGGAYDFHDMTGGRFQDGLPADTHDTHRWEYVGPRTFACKGTKNKPCDAVRRH